MFALLNSDLLLNARNQAVIDCVIETPKGSRNKFHYDMETGLFRLKKVCPLERSSRTTSDSFLGQRAKMAIRSTYF